MSWLQLQIQADQDNAEAIETALEDCGALSVTLVDAADQPLFEPDPGQTPLWNQVLVTGLFSADTAHELLLMQLLATLPAVPWQQASLTPLEDQDWHRVWMDNFKPMRFGQNLWICPSWHQPPEPNATNLMLDPGMAFGTGTHPTTALCLGWLDGQALQGQQLIDYGCGSGILGLGALLLGARQVHGVDTDPQALQATRDNCAKNQIPLERFPTYLPKAFETTFRQAQVTPVDGMLANILAEPLMQLAPWLAELTKPQGWLLLSGLLESQLEQVIEAYRPWFGDFDTEVQEGWGRISAVRNTDGPASAPSDG